METSVNLNGLDIGVIILYVIALLGLGFWVSFRNKSSHDLFLAGRTLGWANIGLSIWGTNISPSMMIATCGVAYGSGIVMGNSSWLAWIFMLLMAMVFMPYYLHTRVYTMPEFIGLRYGRVCRDFLSYFTIISVLALWLGGTQLAGAKLLSQIIGWPVWACILVLAVVATSFTVTGGLAAVVITDSFQVVLMILASTVLTIIAIGKVGGVTEMIGSVPGDYWRLFKPISDSDWPWDAVVFGYMCSAIWFWCTDQTIVQRALGARSIQQAQKGIVFSGFLKILDPLIFFIPGIICFILYPTLDDPDSAYITMVGKCLPHGMIGLVVAVLMAALISTVDSGLNSLSTVFTLDIYKKQFRPNATQEQTKRVGQIVTLAAAIVSVFLSIVLSFVKMDLFSILGSIIGFIAPAMSTIFLLGVVWKRATSKAAIMTLIGGVLSMILGAFYLSPLWAEEHRPHFMRISFWIWCVLMVFMVVASLLTKKSPDEQPLPTLREAYKKAGHSTKAIWILWGVLAVIMVAIYIVFNLVLPPMGQ